jgi:hypothetical protein
MAESALQDVALPVRLQVLLIGLDGTGQLGLTQKADELQALVATALRRHCPTHVEELRPMRACFAFDVSVVHIPGVVHEVESTMRHAMVLSHAAWLVLCSPPLDILLQIKIQKVLCSDTSAHSIRNSHR